MGEKKDVAITSKSDTYVDRLEAEKRVLEERIRELQAEVRAINTLIYRRKSEIHAGGTGQERNLKNADRLFFEAIVLDALRSSKRGLRTGEIHSAVTKQGYSLNYNTLRSYVTKMRDNGLIRKKTSTSYYWVAETASPTPS